MKLVSLAATMLALSILPAAAQQPPEDPRLCATARNSAESDLAAVVRNLHDRDAQAQIAMQGLREQLMAANAKVKELTDKAARAEPTAVPVPDKLAAPVPEKPVAIPR